MSTGNSPRTFHLPYYPLEGVYREGRRAPTTDEHPAKSPSSEGEKSQGKCTSVKIKRKPREPGKPRIKIAKRKGTTKAEEKLFDQGDELLNFWQTKYEETFRVPYEIGTKTKRLNLCDQLLETLKTPERVRMFMLCLLTHPDMGWVGQKTLEFLVKPSNQSRIAPVLSRRKKNRSRAEYLGDRPTSTKITFRSI